MELVLLQTLSAFMALVFVATTAVCRRMAPNEPGVREWQLAAAFLALTNFSGALRAVIPWQLVVITSHVLGAFGHAYMVRGSRLLLGKSPGRNLIGPLLAIGLTSSLWFILIQPSLNGRLFVIGVVAGTLTFYSGILFWRHREPGLDWLMRPTGITFGVVALAYFLRGVFALFAQPIPEDQATSSPIVWSFSPFAIAFWGMASAALVMVISVRRHAALESERDEEHQANERLLEMSWSDPMTGVASRARITDLLEAECKFAAASGAQPVAVLAQVCAPEGLKSAERDSAIVDAARSLRETLGLGPVAIDCVGRWGFDEFLVILAEVDHVDADTFASRARESLAAGHKGVQACRFVATAFEWGDTADSIGLRLDLGLQQARESGSDHVVYV